MPYVREGKCVYQENSDGSKGELKGCSDSVAMAKKYIQALHIHEKSAYAEFSMAITKASIPDKSSRKMKLSMVSSDTHEDVYEERMSIDLFNDFVERIEKSTPVPGPFDVICEDGWCGGMPYPSISHYKTGAGKNVPGEIEKVYVDGEKLKSTAILHDTPLGVAVWKSVCQDMEERDKPLEEKTFENPIRVSIGFLDLEHKHELEDDKDFVFTRTKLEEKCPKCDEGINGKVYLKGQLVHLAFTRVPANPRTSVEVFRMDEIKTKKDDAKAIVGDLADELVGKSTVEEDVLVVKTDVEDDESRDQKKEEKGEIEEDAQTTPETTEVKMEKDNQVKEPVQEEVAPVVEPQKSAVEVATQNLIAKLNELKEKHVTGDAAIKEIQPVFNDIGAVVKQELSNPLDGVAETMRAIFREEMAALKPELVAEVLKAIPAGTQVKSEVPAPRSLVMERSAHVAPAKEMTEIEKIAYRNTIPGFSG